MIFAVDPGLTTAMAFTRIPVSIVDLPQHLEVREYKVNVPASAPAELIYEAEMDIADDLVNDLERISGGDPIELLLEDFTPRMFNKSRAFLSPVRVTIAILSLLRCTDIPFTLHLPPASKMSTMTDERLRESGLWVVGSDHKRAAVRHLAVYLRK